MDASEKPAKPADASARKPHRMDDERERDWIDLDAPDMKAIAAA